MLSKTATRLLMNRDSSVWVVPIDGKAQIQTSLLPCIATATPVPPTAIEAMEDAGRELLPQSPVGELGGCVELVHG